MWTWRRMEQISCTTENVLGNNRRRRSPDTHDKYRKWIGHILSGDLLSYERWLKGNWTREITKTDDTGLDADRWIWKAWRRGPTARVETSDIWDCLRDREPEEERILKLVSCKPYSRTRTHILIILFNIHFMLHFISSVLFLLQRQLRGYPRKPKQTKFPTV